MGDEGGAIGDGSAEDDVLCLREGRLDLLGHVVSLPKGIDNFLQQLPPFELKFVQVTEGLIEVHKARDYLLGCCLIHR